MDMAGKTNKSFAKRFKVTKKGKVMSRAPGHDHFNAKESGSKKMAKRRAKEFNITKKDLGRYMPFS